MIIKCVPAEDFCCQEMRKNNNNKMYLHAEEVRVSHRTLEITITKSTRYRELRKQTPKHHLHTIIKNKNTRSMCMRDRAYVWVCVHFHVHSCVRGLSNQNTVQRACVCMCAYVCTIIISSLLLARACVCVGMCMRGNACMLACNGCAGW